MIEIDGASNRGIDEIRALREKVNFRPTDARFKVYVIDEVHMLTNEAFNALLKTLEEPPGHVIFVLATTEPHKIPATVLSRCQRFDFRRIPSEAIVERLKYIATQEEIDVATEVLELIARQATGSLRDAISLLDQLVSSGSTTVTMEQVQQILGLVPHQMVHKLTQGLISGDMAGGLAEINEAVGNGADVAQLSRELVEYLRGLLLTKMSGTTGLVNASDEVREVMKREAEQLDLMRLVGWIKIFNQAILEMKTGTYPQLSLEMAWVAALTDVQTSTPISSAQAISPIQTPPDQRGGPVIIPRKDAAAQPEPVAAQQSGDAAYRASTSQPSDLPAGTQPDERVSQTAHVRSATQGDVTLENIHAHWADILSEMRRESHNSSHRMIYALLQACQPVALRDDELVLGFQHDTLAGKLAEPGRAVIAQQVVEQVLGIRLRIKCTVVSGDSSTGRAGPASPKDPGEKAPSSGMSKILPQADDATQLEMATEEVVNDEGERGPLRSDPQDKYGPIVAGDRLVKEAIEKFGAKIEGVEFINDEPEED